MRCLASGEYMTTIETEVIVLLKVHNIPYRLLPHSEPVFTVEAAAGWIEEAIERQDA